MVDKLNFRCCLVVSVLLLILCSSTFGKIIYVDGDTAGINNSSCWVIDDVTSPCIDAGHV